MVAVAGVFVYRLDQRLRNKYEDRFNPTDWGLAPAVDAPASAPAAPRAAPTENIGYRKKSAFLTAEQLRWFEQLNLAMGGDYRVLAKVDLADVMAISSGDHSLVTQAMVKTAAMKQLDLLLCEPRQLEPVCALLVDDQPDALIAAACRAAQLPLVSLVPGSECSAAELRRQVLMAMGIAEPVAVPADVSGTAPGVALAADSALEIIDPQAASQPKLCPKCAASMLQRRVKTGVHQGKLMWVCSSYPECRGVLP